MTHEPERLLTIREAADAAGLSSKAMRSRVDRGQVRVVRQPDRHGQPVRLVPRSELARLGLASDTHDDGELAQLRADLATARADLAASRQLAERAESAQAAEHQAHEHTRAALAEQAAERHAAEQRAEAIAADLDAITAGPIAAWRLRRRRRTLATG